MNHAKLASLGLQKAITACMRHANAMMSYPPGHPLREKHEALRIECHDIAVTLWRPLTPEEQRQLDRSSLSEAEIAAKQEEAEL